MYSNQSNKINKLTSTLIFINLSFITNQLLSPIAVVQCQQQQQQTNLNQTQYQYRVWHRTPTILHNNTNNAQQSTGVLLGQSLVMAAGAGSAAMATPTTTTTLSPPPPLEVPEFNEPIGNHTIALGRDAQLSCKINNLGHFRTAWLRVEDKGILTIHNNIITRNYRVGLINNDDGKNFILTIKNVQPSDKGGYMCQINSVPMKYAIGYLDVLTPPAFDDVPQTTTLATTQLDASSQPKMPALAVDQQLPSTTVSPSAPGASVVTVSEGGNASLSCRANGHPSPTITWRREDNEPILLNGGSTLDGLNKIESPSIQLSSVSRLNSGAYLCIASNGVQPSASKRQVLDVQFSPVVRLPQTEVGGQIGQQEAKLICFVELNPLGTYHWVKLNSGQQQQQQQQRQQQVEDDSSLIEHDELVNSDKFEIVIKQVNSEKVQMILRVRQLERQDFAWYKCIARNTLGTQSSSIRLYESSSFSLNNMFNRGGDGSTGGGGGGQQQPSEQDQQNDQQDQQQMGTGGGGGRPSKQANGLSRAHTRSSWVQRSSSLPGRQQQHDSTASASNTPTNALLDSSSSSAATLLSATYNRRQTTANKYLLLLSSHHHHLILLFNCILLASVAQIVVVANSHTLTHRIH